MAWLRASACANMGLSWHNNMVLILLAYVSWHLPMLQAKDNLNLHGRIEPSRCRANRAQAASDIASPFPAMNE